MLKQFEADPTFLCLTAAFKQVEVYQAAKGAAVVAGLFPHTMLFNRRIGSNAQQLQPGSAKPIDGSLRIIRQRPNQPLLPGQISHPTKWHKYDCLISFTLLLQKMQVTISAAAGGGALQV